MPVHQIQLSPVEQLIKLMLMESETAEELFRILTEQQESLITLSGDALEITVERCTEINRRMRAYEKDRQRLLANVMKGTPAEKYIGAPNAFDRLIEIMDNRGGIKIKLRDARERLRIAVASVVQRNAVNSLLLEHSMHYAQNMIRTITTSFSKQLIDQKL
jgi:hypothetical protein